MNLAKRLVRATRNVLPPLFVMGLFATTPRLAQPALAAAAYGPAWQKIAPAEITTDTHYHLVVENAHARVFALTIPSGQQNFVMHKYNFLTVTLIDSEVIRWKNDESPVQHFPAPKGEIHFFLGKSGHGIRNDSNADYSNITIEFLDPQVTNYGYRYESGKWDFGPSILNAPVDPEGHFVNSLDLEKAVAKDVQLLPKEILPAAKGPQILIALSPLNLSAGADRKISLSPGEVLWRESGDPGLANNGSARERFVVVEFKSVNGKY